MSQEGRIGASDTEGHATRGDKSASRSVASATAYGNPDT